MLFNVAISEFWKHQDPAHPLEFPGQMKVDYVRVYQNAEHPNHSCDPPSHPTSAYINTLSGHYASYGNKYPVPEKRKVRLQQQYKEIERALARFTRSRQQAALGPPLTGGGGSLSLDRHVLE